MIVPVSIAKPDVGFHASPLPTWRTPEQIRSAYQLPAIGGSGAIAIVDAFHYVQAQNDFNVFAAQFGLPLETSHDPTSDSNLVFQQIFVDANGARSTNATTVDLGWNTEAALDTQWAHALAPLAKIYLVESFSDQDMDMDNAVNIAKQLPNVTVVSMSYGIFDNDLAGAGVTLDESVYVAPGVVFVASSGDAGGVVNCPSCSPNVISVGGTSLNLDSNHSFRFLSETAWSGSGGGVSVVESALPDFQTKIPLIAHNFMGRSTPDLSFVADPFTGVAVYISFNFTLPDRWYQGWLRIGGTSLSAPCIAAVLNLAFTKHGVFPSSSQEFLNHMYNSAPRGALRDIKVGQAPFPAKRSWDFTTGLGSPVGLGFAKLPSNHTRPKTTPRPKTTAHPKTTARRSRTTTKKL